MLLLAVIAFVAAALCVSRLPDASNAPRLGWMSEQWLAEYRASHAS